MNAQPALEPLQDDTGRIELAVYSDATELGGAERSLGDVIAALGAHVGVHVVAVDPDIAAWLCGRRPGTRSTLVAPIAGKRDVKAMAEFVMTLRRLRPDVLHVNLRTPWTCQYVLLLGGLVRGVHVVAVEHLPYPPPSRRQRLLRRLAEKRLAAHVCVGRTAAIEVAEQIGIEPEAIRLIHNGVADTRAEPLPLPAGIGRPIVGSLGRLVPQKGYDVLLAALARLPDVQLVIVGEGVERSALAREAEERGIAGRVTLAGWHPEARRYLPNFDLFVLPSRFEGLPLAIIEAMLAGLAVVATDVGSVAECVEDGVTGLLVPPGEVDALVDALRRLLDDEALRRRLGAAGRLVAQERFSVESASRSFEALYAEILPRP